MDDMLEVSVSDTGIGMKPDDRERCLRNSGRRIAFLPEKYEGTGLGLALTKKGCRDARGKYLV